MGWRRPGLTRTAAALAAAWLAAPAARAGALSAEDLAKKREGFFLTGLPLAAYSSDTGFGYGARVYLNANGARTDPAFATTPYRAQVYLQYFATTGGWQYHEVVADLPEFLPRWRARGYAAYERNTNRNYFGTGTVSLSPLPAPDMATYQKRLDAETPLGAGSTNAAFHRYELVRPDAGMQAEHAFGPVASVMAGLEIEKGKVRTFEGRPITVDGNARTQGPTLVGLFRPTGIDGGWLNHVRLGIAIDTRDYEPNPRRGAYLDWVAEWGGPAIGSDYRYDRFTWTGRGYRTLVPSLVLAARYAEMIEQGRVPFYEMGTFGFTDNRRESLGGGWNLRGYRENRFTGSHAALTDVELRWTFGERHAGSQRFEFILVGFADGGRVFSPLENYTLRDWKGDAGGGVRIAWNQSTIVNATYAKSGEDTGVFINFGHQF